MRKTQHNANQETRKTWVFFCQNKSQRRKNTHADCREQQRFSPPGRRRPLRARWKAAKRDKRWVCVGWASAHRVSVARLANTRLAAKRNKRWVCVGWASAHRVSVARFANDGKPPSEVNAGFCRCAVLFNPHPNPSPIKRGGDFFVRDLRSVRAKRGKCWVHRQARQILDLRVGRTSAHRTDVACFAYCENTAKQRDF